MEQSIQGISGAVNTKTMTDSAQQKKTIADLLESGNTDLNELASFFQLLNQQIELLPLVTESADEAITDKGAETIVSGNNPGKNNGYADELSTQGRQPSMMKGRLWVNKNMQGTGITDSSKGVVSTFDGEQNTQISSEEFKKLFQETGESLTEKKEDVSRIVKELPEQANGDQNVNRSDIKSIQDNASKRYAANHAGNPATSDSNKLNAFSGEVQEKISNALKQNKSITDKNAHEIDSKSFVAVNYGNEKIASGGNVSASDMLQQVTREIKENINTEGGRIKITLNPPSLGTLEMDVAVRNNKVEVIIVASSRDVQQALNTNIDHLKGTLQNQGLTIDRCDVLMQMNHEDYPQNSSQQEFYRDGSEKNGNGSKETYNEAFNPVTPDTRRFVHIPSLDPNNISIFA